MPGERSHQPPGDPLDLMQYWNEPAPPPDVEELMDSWRLDPQFRYHRYDRDGARQFLRERFDRRSLALFESCAVPAMQSDVFRLFWLLDQGGVYMDADQGNRGRNDRFTDTTARGHLFYRDPQRGLLCNGLMTFFAPNDPLVDVLLRRVLTNIEGRHEGVWTVSGPGVLSSVLGEVGPDHAWFAGVRLHGVMHLAHAVEFVRCDYKSSPTHWQNVHDAYYHEPPPP